MAERIGEVASNRLEEQELSVLIAPPAADLASLYVSRITPGKAISKAGMPFTRIGRVRGAADVMIQSVLGDRAGSDELAPEDLRALSPLIYNHVNPYGIFELDMEQRIRIAA